MRAKLANLNNSAVSILSRAAANLCWYYYNISSHICGTTSCLEGKTTDIRFAYKMVFIADDHLQDDCLNGIQ